MAPYELGCEHVSLSDITNIVLNNEKLKTAKGSCNVTGADMLPVCINIDTENDERRKQQQRPLFLQNVHPMLAMYKHDLITEHMSYEGFLHLVAVNNEEYMLQFLGEIGIIASEHQCEFCGANMKQRKQGKNWYWICMRRVAGIKCNRGKFPIRKGTFFDNSKMYFQSILRIVWNFVHRLNTKQCQQFCGLSTKTDHTVGEFYGDCRTICTRWIWDPKNMPKLGGYGKVVEMDESFFPGAPKIQPWTQAWHDLGR